MATIEFVGQSSRDSTARPANTSRLINLYRERVEEGGLTRYILRSVPGMAAKADLGQAFLRRLKWVDSKVFAVGVGQLWQIALDGTKFSIGSITDDINTDISGNTGNVTVTAAGKYYLWDGTSITQPSGVFSDFGSVETLGGYTLLTEKNGRRIQWSDLADPSTLPGLNFATTESRDDYNIRGMTVNGQYWVFKQRSTEVWYETGLSGADAFARLAGGTLDKGLAGFNLVCKAREAAFFIGSDGVAYLTAGGQPQPVSSRAVEVALEYNDPTHCFYYEDEGHKFCVIRFSDRPAWVFDIATTEWHERAEGKGFLPWTAVDAVEAFAGVHWLGLNGGDVVECRNIYMDLEDTLYRRAVSRTIRVDSRRFRVKELEFYGAYGYAPATQTSAAILGAGDGGYDMGKGSFYAFDLERGTEPALMVSFSNDGGGTFGQEKWRPLGAQGEYDTRVLYRSLGQFRQFTAQVDITHRFDIPLYADARMEIG